MKIEAINNKIILKNEDVVKTQSGLYVPQNTTNRLHKLRVVSVAKGIEDIKLGDYVIVDKNLGIPFDDDYIIFEYENIFAKVSDEKN